MPIDMPIDMPITEPTVQERVAAGLVLLERHYGPQLDEIDPATVSVRERPCLLERLSGQDFTRAAQALAGAAWPPQFVVSHGLDSWSGADDRDTAALDAEWRRQLADRKAAQA